MDNEILLGNDLDGILFLEVATEIYDDILFEDYDMIDQLADINEDEDDCDDCDDDDDYYYEGEDD